MKEIKEVTYSTTRILGRKLASIVYKVVTGVSLMSFTLIMVMFWYAIISMAML